MISINGLTIVFIECLMVNFNFNLNKKLVLEEILGLSKG